MTTLSEISLTITPFSSSLLTTDSDIFSLYKEELGNDTKNFVNERAYVTNKDMISALYDIVDETVASTCNVRLVLAGEKERQTWERFIDAYLAFHLETPRYRLHEILG